MLLRVDYSTEADTAAIDARGEIDLATVSSLRNAITHSIQAGARHLTVNLDHVTYIDSSGLGALIGAHKRLHATGGTLRIRCSQDRVLRLLQITGLDRVLTITVHGDEKATPIEVADAQPA